MLQAARAVNAEEDLGSKQQAGLVILFYTRTIFRKIRRLRWFTLVWLFLPQKRTLVV
jgi:hypothetical protein